MSEFSSEQHLCLAQMRRGSVQTHQGETLLTVYLHALQVVPRARGWAVLATTALGRQFTLHGSDCDTETQAILLQQALGEAARTRIEELNTTESDFPASPGPDSTPD